MITAIDAPTADAIVDDLLALDYLGDLSISRSGKDVYLVIRSPKGWGCWDSFINLKERMAKDGLHVIMSEVHTDSLVARVTRLERKRV